MKEYEIEFKRTSFITVNVKAKDEDEAEDKAWKELEETYEQENLDDAEWEIEILQEKQN